MAPPMVLSLRIKDSDRSKGVKDGAGLQTQYMQHDDWHDLCKQSLGARNTKTSHELTGPEGRYVKSIEQVV